MQAPPEGSACIKPYAMQNLKRNIEFYCMAREVYYLIQL